MAYIERVIRTLVCRLTALLLTGLVASGGGTAPLFDALSHGSDLDYAGIPHFEATNATDSHRDFCSLGSGLPLAAHLAPFRLSIPIGTLAFRETPNHPRAPRTADLNLLPQPRAPPSVSV
jgi:hypothetical protein